MGESVPIYVLEPWAFLFSDGDGNLLHAGCQPVAGDKEFPGQQLVRFSYAR